MENNLQLGEKFCRPNLVEVGIVMQVRRGDDGARDLDLLLGIGAPQTRGDHGYLRAAKAINSRSAKTNSRSAQWQLPLLQRVSMLASPRGDLHSRSSWPKSDQKMVAARQALNADYRMQLDECHSFN